MKTINRVLLQGDCLEILRDVPSNSVDLILADLPYGTTQCSWDSVIPLDLLWSEFNRVSKETTAVVLTSCQPFTTALITSNMRDYRYSWVWNKVNKFSGHLNAKKQPLRIVEDVCVFYKRPPTYNPQMTEGKPYKAKSSGKKSDNFGKQQDGIETINTGLYYPKNLLSIAGDERGSQGRIHPTQKPVALMEYFIKTYTNPGDIVLDPTMGSGTTGLACKNLDRSFIGIEKDLNYFNIAEKRLA